MPFNFIDKLTKGELPHRQLLALDALSKLAKHFSHRPDFKNIIEIFLLTLLGQFSVASAFIIFFRSIRPGDDQQYFATGLFKNNELLSSLEFSEKHIEYLLDNRIPHLVNDLDLKGRSANLKFILSECDVRLLAPLVHNDELLAVVGLGHKVTSIPFDNTDIGILSTIINTVTPFIANIFLFSEMTELGKWYLSIMNNVKQGVYVFSRDWRLKKINYSGFRILKGFRPTAQDAESLFSIPVELIFPGTIFPAWSDMFKSKYAQAGEWQFDNLRARNQETDRIFSVKISSLKDDIAHKSDIIITLDDITEQKANEQRLFNLEKLADRGAMLASITHELNNHLGMILGGVEIADYSLDKGDLEKVGVTLERINTAVQKMKRFTSGLTDYTKMNSSKQKCNINKIIGDVLTFISVQARFRIIKIVTDLDNNIPDSELDSDQIAQVLLNFLHNAADSIDEAGRKEGVIVVKSEANRDHIKLTISDNGTGIPEENREKMFKLHFTTKKDGHGYGLITCARIIKNHNGRISFNPKCKRGAEFTITIKI